MKNTALFGGIICFVAGFVVSSAILMLIGAAVAVASVLLSSDFQ